jgi:hypothetical protein
MAPGCILGLLSAGHLLLANELAPPLDGNGLRLLSACIGAGAMEGLGVGLFTAAVASLTRGLWAHRTSPFTLHASAAAGLWSAWALLAPTLMPTESPRIVLAMRGAALVCLFVLPVLAFVLLRGVEGRALRNRSWLAVRRAAVALLVAVLALPVVTTAWSFRPRPAPAPADARPERGPVFAPVPGGLVRSPAGRPVIVVGVDGLGWDLLVRGVESGRAPHLARILAGGASGQLKTMIPTLSPRIWTTILTGRVPEDHGIVHFSVVQYPRLGIAGLQQRRTLLFAKPVLDLFDTLQWVPISGLARRAKAIWNLCTEADMSVGIFGAWSTYPAEEVNGTIVSDHAFHRPADLAQRTSGLLLDASEDQLTFPPGLMAELQRFQGTVEANGPDAVEPFVHFQPGDRENMEALLAPSNDLDNKPRLRMMALSTLRDEFIARSALHVFREGAPDFSFVYLVAIDSFSHMIFEFTVPDAAEFGWDPVDIARYGESIDRALARTDEWIGELVASAPQDAVVVILSDHGWHREGSKGGKPVYGHYEAPPGVVLLAGPGIPKGATIEGAHVHDIAPTLAYLLGLPLSEEFEGELLSSAIDAELLRETPPRRVASYGHGERGREIMGTTDEDDAMLDRLRALGYLD